VNGNQNLPTSHERVNAPPSARTDAPAHTPARRIAPPVAIVFGTLCLVVWASLVLATDPPGAVHLLLSGGLYLLIWGIVSRTA